VLVSEPESSDVGFLCGFGNRMDVDVSYTR
jgi:hypothetical protein